MSSDTARARRRVGAGRHSRLLLTGGIVLVALNLRPAAASLGPVLGRIESSVGISSGVAGLLTTLPVLCFGLLAPVAPMLARRVGLRASLGASMWLLLLGSLLRLVPGAGLLFLGTALAGAAIAVGNVLLPVLVRRDFPDRTGAATALYSTVLIGFASLTAGITVPVANALGGGWRPGLGVWAVPAALAALAWTPVAARRVRRHASDGAPVPDAPPPSSEAGGGGVRRLLREPLAWQVTLFFALQSGLFYSTLAWLPSIFHSHGASEETSGLLLSISMAVGLLAAPSVPALATRRGWARPLAVLCCALTAAGLLGILLAPMASPYLWVVLLGLGQNASFPLSLMLIVMRGGSVASTQALSTMAQSIGYVLAAFAPLAFGAIHGAAGSWSPALVLLLALVAPELALGLAAARERRLDGAALPVAVSAT